MKHDEKPEVPRLSSEIKKLNGKSGYRLRQCIDTLCEILDDKENESDKAQVPQDN